jgi:ribosomal protein S18 acetylase RimI-like enzyme
VSLELLKSLEDSNNVAVALGRKVINVGCFRLLLNPEDGFPNFNYAVPLEGANDSEIAQSNLEPLFAAFKAADRLPRFEFTAELWPNLAGVLEAAGFTHESTDPVMLVDLNSFKPFLAPNVQVRFLEPNDPDSDLATMMSIQTRGFGTGEDRTPSEDEIASTRASMRHGRRNALATLSGQPAGAGVTLEIAGIAELAGVATLLELRRHGVAASVSSALCEVHFQNGGNAVWLSAGDDAAQACYEKIGFRLIGGRTNYRREPSSS